MSAQQVPLSTPPVLIEKKYQKLGVWGLGVAGVGSVPCRGMLSSGRVPLRQALQVGCPQAHSFPAGQGVGGSWGAQGEGAAC